MNQFTKSQEPTTVADRGGVYEFLENDGTYNGKLCLVVSNQDRSEDNIISILLLSENTARFGKDCVEIPVSNNKLLLARCGLVTYCRRSNLGCKIYQVSKHTMKYVTASMKVELGMENRSHSVKIEADEETPDYKKLYNDLVKIIIYGNNKPVDVN